jgi:hypothetical protein
MLGLNLAVNKRPEESAATATQTRPIEADANRYASDFRSNPVRTNEYRANDSSALRSESNRFDDFSADSFREQSFSGLNSYIDQDEPKSGAGRVILLLLLLAALGVAGWWTYNNYRGVAQTRKAQSDAANAVEAPADSQSTPSTSSPAPAPTPAPVPAPEAAAKQPSDVAEGPSENASPAPDANAASDNDAANTTPPAQKATPAVKTEPKPPPAQAKTPAPKRVAPARQPAVTTARTSREQAAPEPEDTGDASFRKAEAYLYGRGAPQNCDEAVKNLKAASAKSNAKARSAFGTMYATGHCVPRDLPTSYLWFALALRVDPNNQILEKDLTAVWNQMTPPERQMATRMKQ